MVTMMDFISTSATAWLLIGAFVGGALGSVITFVVAEKIGIEKGAELVQKFYEQAYVDKVNRIREPNNTDINDGKEITLEDVDLVCDTFVERI